MSVLKANFVAQTYCNIKTLNENPKQKLIFYDQY